MGRSRLLVAMFTAAVAVAGLAILWSLSSSPEGASASFPLRVVGPEGGTIFEGHVFVANATALSVLQAAGEQADFAVKISWYASYGSEACSGYYVESIAGRPAEGSSGWVYRVLQNSPGSRWTHPAHSAACEGLSDGDQVEWHWSDAPVGES